MKIRTVIKKIRGFTLIELMVVIGIVALLVGLAIPSFQTSIRKGRRADAQADMIEFAGCAERVFTATNSYLLADDDCQPDNTPHYTYSFPVAATATAWTIRSTPNSSNGQNKDRCGTMNLTHTGFKTHTGPEDDCWETD